jgi:hypothetical protein
MKIGDLILLGGLGFLALWLLNAAGPTCSSTGPSSLDSRRCGSTI